MLISRLPSSVLVVSSSSKITELLDELLPAHTFAPIVTASSCGEAKRALMNKDYDIIVINSPLHDEFGSEFALDCVQNGTCAVLLLAASEIYEQVSYSVECSGVMTVSKPLNRTLLLSAMHLAYATHARLSLFEKKNKNLNAKIGEIRLINRAKWTLIEQLSMSEEQAHRYIEKQAMDLRLTKREVSENIIKTYEK